MVFLESKQQRILQDSSLWGPWRPWMLLYFPVHIYRYWQQQQTAMKPFKGALGKRKAWSEIILAVEKILPAEGGEYIKQIKKKKKVNKQASGVNKVYGNGGKSLSSLIQTTVSQSWRWRPDMLTTRSKQSNKICVYVCVFVDVCFLFSYRAHHPKHCEVPHGDVSVQCRRHEEIHLGPIHTWGNSYFSEQGTVS